MAHSLCPCTECIQALGSKRQNLDDPDVCSLLNSNFWVQLFALFAVLRILWIVLALRTSPLDDEEDDNEKDDNCKKDPDHDRHQKSIWILLSWVDFVWFFGRDPRAEDAVRVKDSRLETHGLVCSSREVLDHEGSVLGHL